MPFYSTNNKELKVNLRTAIYQAVPQDKGLYMPYLENTFSSNELSQLKGLSFNEVALKVASKLLHEDIEEVALNQLIKESFRFSPIVERLNERIYSLDLSSGPSLAFKDYGAQFLSKLMSYYSASDLKTTILVATSGDTGGAVASAFLNIPNIEVIILYPKNGISVFQKNQMNQHKENIYTLEVDGNFDDCQSIMKRSLIDKDFISKYKFSTANSVNIGRLLAQMFYYFYAYSQIESSVKPSFSIPCGNLGNITAAMLSHYMGLNVSSLIAGTNANDTFVQYLETGVISNNQFTPTLANAMDVAIPSNIYRIKDIQSSTWNIKPPTLKAYSFSDKEIIKGIESSYSKLNVLLDPHSSISYLALEESFKDNNNHGIFLKTASHLKFSNTMKMALGDNFNENSSKGSCDPHKSMDSSYKDFKTWLLNRI